MEESKLYKYTSVETAIRIINTEKILLNSPDNFNDPFDSEIYIEEYERYKALDLFINFYFQYLLKEDKLKFNFKEEHKNKAKYLKIKIKNKIKKRNEFEYINDVDSLIELLNDDDYKKISKELRNKYDEEIKKVQRHSREEMLITCFSERNNSILMWSHYGNLHKGVCLEFENDINPLYIVNYSNEKPKFNIELATKIVIDAKLKHKKPSLNDNLRENIISLFKTKSKDWEYEKEVRFITNVDEVRKGLSIFAYQNVSDGKYYCNCTVKKIYIGVKANGEQLNRLIQMALNRNIPIVYMKEDEKDYSIIEDTKREVKIINYEQTNEINCIEQLRNEIQNCLKQRNYISALVSSLLIPSILGQFEYKELSKKESYVKWFNEHVKQGNEDNMNGDICWKIYESVNNKGILFNNENNNLKINFNIHKYDDLPLDEMSPNSEVNILDLDISNFCNNIIDGSKYAIDYKGLSHFKISDFDKKNEDILSLNRPFQRNSI